MSHNADAASDTSEGGTAGASADEFSKWFFAGVSIGELSPAEHVELTRAATELLALARVRPAGRPVIAISGRHLAIVNDDMPFLVDSVTARLEGEGLEIDRLIHPIIPVERDRNGHIISIGSGKPESMILAVLKREPPQEFPVRLERVLDDVRIAVSDYAAMLDVLSGVERRIAEMPPSEDASESMAFLSWMKADHYTFLGSRSYVAAPDGRMEPEDGSGLGLLRNERAPVLEGPRAPSHDGRLISVGQTPQLSSVHRRAPMDVVIVREGEGRIRVFLGLFTGRAYGRAARDIPLLRRKVAEVAHRAGFPSDTHNGSLLLQILDTYPREELFQVTEDELFGAALQLMALEKRPRFGLFVRRDPVGPLVSLMIYVPRRRFDFELRQRLEQAAMQAIEGADSILVSETSISGGEQLLRLHLLLSVDPAQLPNLDPPLLEQRLSNEVSDWSEKLANHLTIRFPEVDGLGERYAHAFPASYRQGTTPLEAMEDVAAIEMLLTREGDNPLLRVTTPLDRQNHTGAAVLTLYRQGTPIALSDLLPLLERFGFRVLTEAAFRVTPEGSAEIALQSLVVEVLSGALLDDHGALLTEAFDAVWLGEAESDDLDRLIMLQGLSTRQITIVRAYAKYLRQARFRFSQEAIEASFMAYPGFASLLVSYFETAHAPGNREEAEIQAEEIERQILKDLETVSNADDDAIFRAILLVMRSTLRTNYYQRGQDGAPKPVLSLKIDSQAIASLLPPPAPLVEIFVYSARVEAVHLRGGKIARGGIRWSDRREDFRTEILGLMKAQMVKNTVIVPVGSKGGFVCKRPPLAGGRPALQAEGIACYRLMMQGLLDITDNLASDGKVQPPPMVARLDADDPYLVVAADKGTATFSDIANDVSQSYGFWLDDAFASGGSSGYDHKRMGITAKGAWESVKRHFREMGRNVQTQPTTVAGVGDMSGDVFGNGLLQSKTLKLIAAFDHRHIFLDPSPNPDVSYKERQRLFDLPGSSWDDYDRALLSNGGGIHPRSAKSIDLSPEIRAALGIEDERVSPSELIRAILRAPVDLMFFGGIGTYVKSAQETNAEVGDRANDANRIDGHELRAAVVAEGANLGCTQQGRIEFAAKGGRINTDFIDNSAGVDTSDHEVNIKILMKPLLDGGKLTPQDRDSLLAEMTDEVGRLVLSDNYHQTQALSRLEARKSISFDGDVRFMRALERKGQLDRNVENLPNDEELSARAATGSGLTRPELAVLLAYGKLTGYERLIHSKMVPAGFDDELQRYFPTPLRKQYAKEIKSHPLRREIVMTRLINEVVNRAGPTFLYDIETRTGAEMDTIVAAFLRASDAFALRDIWAEIETRDGIDPAAEQTRMMLITESLLGRVVPRLIRPGAPVAADPALDRAAVKALTAAVDASPETKGMPVTLNRRLGLFSRLTPALDLVPLAKSTEVDLPTLAKLHVEVTQRFGFGWLAYTASVSAYSTDWERRAADALVDETYDRAAELVSRIAVLGSPKKAVERFAASHAREVARLDATLTEAMGMPSIRLPQLSLLASELRRLILAAREYKI